MELTEQEIRKLAKSTADVYLSLSLQLTAWTLAAVGMAANRAYIFSLDLAIKFLIFLTIMSFVVTIYLKFLHKWTWKRKDLVEFFSKLQMQMKYMSWSLGITAIGISLVNMTDCWATKILITKIFGVSALGIIVCGVYTYKTGGKTMGSKGRKNVKKAKKAKETKGAQQAATKK